MYSVIDREPVTSSRKYFALLASRGGESAQAAEFIRLDNAKMNKLDGVVTNFSTA